MHLFRNHSPRASRLLLTSAALAALLAPTALAAQEEGKGGLLSLHGGLMFWTLIIFALLLFVLTRYAFGAITAAVEARERALEEAIEQAKRDREEAARLLEEHRRQIEAARDEAQRLIAEGRSVGERMRADLLEQARQEQHEIIQRAKREIGSEKERAIAELRAEAVDLAIAGASKVIEENLDDERNRRLVEGFLESVTPKRVRR
jgi:F-type H+-transporting ATPase subunit b